MGRHSGFIACYASLANHDADFVLIPEVPFALDGPGGFLPPCTSGSRAGAPSSSSRRAPGRTSWPPAQAPTRPATSAGRHRAAPQGGDHRPLRRAGTALTLKYIDPGYTIRSVPANAHDAVYCVRLAQAAVHAGMAGRTEMVVGRRHNRFIHVPIAQAVSYRNLVAPDGDLWLWVLESTAQPMVMADLPAAACGMMRG